MQGSNSQPAICASCGARLIHSLTGGICRNPFCKHGSK